MVRTAGQEPVTIPPISRTGTASGVRFATFNASLFRACRGELAAELSAGVAPQVRAVAETIQRSRPDVLLLNEFEYDPTGVAVEKFREHYLAVSQYGAPPIDYPHVFTAAVNSGVQTGFDLDRDGIASGPHDAHGYGYFPGQYGMVVLSRFPIELERIRTFQTFRWTDMPGAMLPADPYQREPAGWYPDEAVEVLRLSSRSHWDVPIRIGSSTVHLLAAHPTPPVFDGHERRNQLRNHDEIRFWADYVTAGRGAYIYDDRGVRGGLPPDEPFVIAGDLNADPLDGFRLPGAISRLLAAPRVRDPRPGSAAGVLAALRQLRGGRTHVGNPFQHTTDFGDEIFGNMRLDYVLPSTELSPLRQSVFWPVPGTALARLNGVSDHRLVWVDALIPTTSGDERSTSPFWFVADTALFT